MSKKGRQYKKHSSEFKIGVIMDMREHHLGYAETMRKYFPERESKNISMIQKWERIFLEEGAEGLMKERRGRACAASGTKKWTIVNKMDKKCVLKRKINSFSLIRR